ncbi:MAG: hypothetical protein QGG98_05760 [Pseudomonadales bacterium]|jgi:hypothetical protein|nr:hypothetical protein [Pseudomonadales bacterium]|tara:strand:+ start:764 stop:1426 length:663 start_codon:yes stop_codon:yes gene_type:complete
MDDLFSVAIERTSKMLLSLLAALSVSLIAGCGTSVAVKGTLPTPVVRQIPLHVGVLYTSEFKEFLHTERVRERGTYKIDIGQQNYSFFQRLFEAMFVESREVSAPPLSSKDSKGLAGIIVPKITKYGFLSPHISGLKFYSASIQYHMTIYDMDGVPLAEWDVVGYGKTPSSSFGEGEALGEATMLAIRDGGARIAMETVEQPGVRKWLSSNGIGIESRAD